MSLDLLFLTMLAIDVLLIYSIISVRRGNYRLHKRIQIVMTCCLALAVVIFEVDIRFLTNWRDSAALSPYFDSGWVLNSLYIHLAFAIPTPFIWGTVVILAIRRFESPPQPSMHSKTHKRIGWLAAGMMFATSITGSLFYYLAFVA